MTPEAVYRAAWIGTGVSTASAIVLTVAAYFLYVALLGSTRMRPVAITIAVVVPLIAAAISPLIIDVVVNALVNRGEQNGSFPMFHVYVDPGPLQKLIPLTAILVTWFVVLVLLRRSRRANAV